jgi:hypothetical protein
MNAATWIATAAAVAAVLLSARPLHWAYQLIQGTHDFITEWPRMREAITELREEVADIKAETRPNGGSSMRDVVARTAEDVSDIKHRQALIGERIEQLESLRAGREQKGPK